MAHGLNDKDTRSYISLQTPERPNEMKALVHGYIGMKASSELEKFMSDTELKRIAHKEGGVWIAATRSTFHTYRPDLFPEWPYLVHQNSPLAWAILIYIHRQQDDTPLQRPSTNLHRQQNTLFLESLKYAVILHAKKILRTIENSCMKCLRRKQAFLSQ